MIEKEKQMQSALGTMKRQKFVLADWKDTNGLIEDFQEAIENFGLFMYEHPECAGSDMYGFVISNEQLTDEQMKERLDNNQRTHSMDNQHQDNLTG